MSVLQQSLKWQLFIMVAAMMGFLIPIFGWVRYEMQRRDASAEFEQRVTSASDVLSVALREPLWDLDETQIEEAVRSLSSNTDLLAVRLIENGPSQYERLFVRDANNQLALQPASSSAQIESAAVKHQFNVSWKDTELAKGELSFSDSIFNESLRTSLTLLIGQLLLFGVLVLGLLYYLVLRYVGQPLMHLRDAMSESDTTALAKVVEQLPANELRLLAERYTAVLLDLREHQQHLTEMVLSRTRALSEANEQLEGEIQRRARIEQELIQARELAEQANEAKTYFLAHMSHELRTPLNGIIGYTQLLQQINVDVPTQKEYVRHIDICANHLLELINRVLDLSKIEQGGTEKVEQSFDLPRLLDEVIAVVRPRCDSRGVQLRSAWAALPASVVGDGTKLRQILINLLGNAAKFTDNGAITLSVKTVDVDVLEFAVTDTGIGIAAKDLSRVFEPFQQAGSASQQLKEGGTGLGLSIARRFVELLGGKLEVSSAVGQGSRFYFQLRLPAAADIVAESDSRHISGLVGDIHPHVLIVDDVEHNRDILAQLLQRLGFDVELARSGEEALQCVAKRKPDLVFLDIRMPDMDGISCAKLLREQYGPLPLLAFTASLFDPHLDQDIKNWFDGLALKPININDICEQIARLLKVSFSYSEQDVAAIAINEQRQLPLRQLEQLGEVDMNQLRNLLANGSIAKIREYATRLVEEQPEVRALAENLLSLARTYDIEGLRRLLNG